jgi:hypothetical protein
MEAGEKVQYTPTKENMVKPRYSGPCKTELNTAQSDHVLTRYKCKFLTDLWTKSLFANHVAPDSKSSALQNNKNVQQLAEKISATVTEI